jgi:flagellar hook-associated protein 3 FlgL
MRITPHELNNHVQRTLARRYYDLSHLQEMLSTGRRLLRPSDDPVDVANDLQLRTKGVQQDQYKENINDGMAFMNVTETAMDGMVPLLQRLSELAVQASSDTFTANQRALIQKEVDQLVRQVITLANTNYKGDYIFGGTQTKIQPLPVVSSQGKAATDYSGLKMAWYDGSGGIGVPAQLRDGFTGENITQLLPGSFSLSVGGTTYVEGTDYTVDYVNGTITPLTAALTADVSDLGTFAGPNYAMNGFNITFDYISQGKDIYGDPVIPAGDILREVDKEITVPININANELFRDPAKGINTLQSLISFSQSLLANDRPGIEQAIGRINDESLQLVLSARTQNGARINRFESTIDRNESQQIETARLQSEIEDTDYADTISKFSQLETIYNGALKSASHVLQPTLVDFL